MMNKIMASVLAAGSVAAAAAQAQSSVTVYGRLDLGLRYSSNQNKNGDGRTEVMSGATSPSRWGVRGMEELGAGMKALVVLEGGINPDTGTAAQSGRLFGRTASVGLAGAFGTVTAGRQVSAVYETMPLNEPFGWANLYEDGYIYDNYTSKRWDNSLKYAGSFGAVKTALMLGLGERAGDNRAGRNAGASVSYAAGALALNGAYQQTRNAKAVADHKALTVGGSYSAEPFKFFLNYLRHSSDLTAQRNDVWATGLTYALTPRVDLVGALYYDRQKDVAGNKKSGAGMVNYKLSKRSNVYLQADYRKTDAGYASNVFDDQGFALPAGIHKRASVTVGMRHQF
ncbi:MULTISPECIES: porin [unclassified Janthinobacterium]|uniref:porin n=1 Tax=unclassified Janthinobacterium TaxID=2610881 RepID=UPI00034C7251|nr:MULTISPECIES: porin [unclassified Janthinobacterium]MEC5162068.1 putative porin [Janthinobacterium sp. CG_S6]